MRFYRDLFFRVQKIDVFNFTLGASKCSCAFFLSYPTASKYKGFAWNRFMRCGALGYLGYLVLLLSCCFYTWHEMRFARFLSWFLLFFSHLFRSIQFSGNDDPFQRPTSNDTSWYISWDAPPPTNSIIRFVGGESIYKPSTCHYYWVEYIIWYIMIRSDFCVKYIYRHMHVKHDVFMMLFSAMKVYQIYYSPGRLTAGTWE